MCAVAHFFALYYAARAMTEVARQNSQSLDLAKITDGLDLLGLVLLLGAFLIGIPSILKDRRLRTMVAVAFFFACFLYFLTV
jgi:hypothetical protein